MWKTWILGYVWLGYIDLKKGIMDPRLRRLEKITWNGIQGYGHMDFSMDSKLLTGQIIRTRFLPIKESVRSAHTQISNYKKF